MEKISSDYHGLRIKITREKKNNSMINWNPWKKEKKNLLYITEMQTQLIAFICRCEKFLLIIMQIVSSSWALIGLSW